ncbi:MAG TPA: short-chain dehydrogenase/reductase [Chloroflexi bacterium]|nr:short-chain dehydrogenase/reductase [Chloroflexota bacterium]HCU97927.1 short-chain dehydrogenase/reductase [Chloroflexota bacterium]|tara:strand:- start:241 stop:1101 length:861 start_codon:yes stop_codon:yes gene_type:complete
MNVSLNDKSVLITGASTGIGRACALHLDQLGFQVFAGIRKQNDAESLLQSASNRLKPIYLDILKPDMISKASQTIEEEVKNHGLYGLINNAGIVTTGPLEFVPIDSIRTQFEVNVIGQIAVTQSFLHLIRLGQGRIINISSVSGRVASPFLGPYAASKFALEALSDSMRVELKPWNIHVAVIEPGPISTPIWNKSKKVAQTMLSKLPITAKTLYGDKIKSAMNWEKKLNQSMSSPDVVVNAIEHALLSNRPRTRYRIGVNGIVADLLARLASDKIRDWLITKQRNM